MGPYRLAVYSVLSAQTTSCVLRHEYKRRRVLLKNDAVARLNCESYPSLCQQKIYQIFQLFLAFRQQSSGARSLTTDAGGILVYYLHQTLCASGRLAEILPIDHTRSQLFSCLASDG